MLYCFNHNFRKKASEYAFEKKYLSMITLEQSAIVLEPNNWNLKEEDNYELQLIWKITKILKTISMNKIKRIFNLIKGIFKKDKF